MPRPELGPLARGDIVIMRAGRRLDDGAAREMTVVTLGPKWVGLCSPRWAGTDLQAPYTRRFLLRDQREGEPAGRVGYGASFATREQHAWDVRVAEAERYVRDVAGLDIRRGAVPFAGEDGLLKLAYLLNLMESSWRPEDTAK